jgi:hypothetical protein
MRGEERFGKGLDQIMPFSADLEKSQGEKGCGKTQALYQGTTSVVP